MGKEEKKSNNWIEITVIFFLANILLGGQRIVS